MSKLTTSTFVTLAIALGLIALVQPAGAAEKPTPQQLADREAACNAKPYHSWTKPHAAGEINPKSGQPYKRDSNGQCRVDSRAVKSAVEAGTLKK